jgi:aryl-alcohol dehydrogenase-like predicted oxidoreductase
MGNLGQEEATQMVKAAVDRGINFIDTPNLHPTPKYTQPAR